MGLSPSELGKLFLYEFLVSGGCGDAARLLRFRLLTRRPYCSFQAARCGAASAADGRSATSAGSLSGTASPSAGKQTSSCAAARVIIGGKTGTRDLRVAQSPGCHVTSLRDSAATRLRTARTQIRGEVAFSTKTEPRTHKNAQIVHFWWRVIPPVPPLGKHYRMYQLDRLRDLRK